MSTQQKPACNTKQRAREETINAEINIPCLLTENIHQFDIIKYIIQ